MSMERPSLAGAFDAKRTAPDRAAALTGLLPHPRPKVEAASELPAETRAAPTRSSVTRRPADSTPRERVQGAPNPAGEGRPVTNVAVYLEPEVRQALQAERRATGASYDELVVEAFAAVTDAALQAQFRPAQVSPRDGGMPQRQRRVRGTAGIQLQLRLDGQQRAWLDDKRELVGAPSRSALVAACLRLHLHLH